MARMNATLICDMRQGPGLRAMIRTLRVCFDMLEVIPEWNTEERRAIKRRIRRLRRELKHMQFSHADAPADPQSE